RWGRRWWWCSVTEEPTNAEQADMLAFLAESNRIGAIGAIEVIPDVCLTKAIVCKECRVVRQREVQPRDALPFESGSRPADGRHAGDMLIVVDIPDADAAAERNAPAITDTPIVDDIEQGGACRRSASQIGLCNEHAAFTGFCRVVTVKAELKLRAEARVPFVTSRSQIDCVPRVARGDTDRRRGKCTSVNPQQLVVAGA